MPELKEQLAKASREELVLMLYNGAIKFGEEAKALLAARDNEGAHDKLIRAQNIVLELKYALDRKNGGVMAENLAKLYEYSYHRLVEANIHHSTERVEDALGIIRGLRDAWQVALDNLRKERG